MRVNVIGLGYVGLTLALVLANVGHKVTGVDINKKIIELLKSGKPTMYEPQLEYMLKSNLEKRNIEFSTTLSNNNASYHIVSVGTPIDENKMPVFNYLSNTLTQVGQVLNKGDIVILRSTVQVGVTRNTAKPILEKISQLRCPDDFHLAFCPERTLQGNALEELRKLSQIVGGIDEESIEKATKLFHTISKTIVKVSSLETAEMIKLVDNTYRDVTISIGNMIGKICTKLGLDAKEVIESANYGYDRNKVLFPGTGVGGGCLRKDPYLLLSSFGNDKTLDLVRSARELNDSMIQETIELIKKGFNEIRKKIKGSRILVLGFAFKGEPKTDDIRYSPTIPLVEYLKKEDAILDGYDPVVPAESIQNLGVNPTSLGEFRKYDCVIIANNSNEFKNLNFEKFGEENPNLLLVIDGWYLYDSKILNQQPGLRYLALGGKND